LFRSSDDKGRGPESESGTADDEPSSSENLQKNLTIIVRAKSITLTEDLLLTVELCLRFGAADNEISACKSVSDSSGDVRRHRLRFDHPSRKFVVFDGSLEQTPSTAAGHWFVNTFTPQLLLNGEVKIAPSHQHQKSQRKNIVWSALHRSV
jgi:hypothetical protein